MSFLSSHFSSKQSLTRRAPACALRLASAAADVPAAQAPRFEVFNLELDAGLAQSCDTGLDADLTLQDEATGAAAFKRAHTRVALQRRGRGLA